MKNRHSAFLLAAALTVVGSGCAHRGDASRAVPPAGPTYTGAPAGYIPAGTELILRNNETVNTERAIPGRTYSAEIESPLVDDRGVVIVPKGSPAQLYVVSSTGGGTFGTPQLQLALRSVTVNGRTYNVVAQTYQAQGQQQGLGANTRTGEMVGGGAVLGAIIGAVAGGGAGAAIGGLAGAAGGAAVQVVTKGKHVTVPAETILTFRLDRPIRLVGYGGGY